MSQINDYIIIDPKSPEAVRSSFCWLHYLIYSALKEKGERVELIEGYEPQDYLPPAKKIIVNLWSYPQINICKSLAFSRRDVYFIGYKPLIDSLKLPHFDISQDDILLGMKTCVKYYHQFKEILLSDSDMHVKKYYGTAWPLFTTYGCVNKCKFCPVAANCQGERIDLPIEDVFALLDICEARGYKSIHFADEDFFYDIDRANKILQYTKNKGFQYIALGTAGKVLNFINQYGAKTFLETGMKVIEVGLETANKVLNLQMEKANLGGENRYERLALGAKGYVDIFWLTMTFFPGETLSSLNETGKFLMQYGYQYGDLYERIQTNSSVGGLGQFFLPYIGARPVSHKDGATLSTSSFLSRLQPNFIPWSFLESPIKNIRTISLEEEKWFYLYGFSTQDISIINSFLEPKKEEELLSVSDLFFGLSSIWTARQVACILAICARLGVIQ